MTVAISQAHNNARLLGTLGFLDSGPANAQVRIYGGDRPATADEAPTSVMLGAVSLSKPSGSVDAGVLTLAQLEPALATNTGLATWVRVVNGDGIAAFDCDVGLVGSGAPITFADLQIYAGGELSMTSGVLG